MLRTALLDATVKREPSSSPLCLPVGEEGQSGDSWSISRILSLRVPFYLSDALDQSSDLSDNVVRILAPKFVPSSPFVVLSRQSTHYSDSNKRCTYFTFPLSPSKDSVVFSSAIMMNALRNISKLKSLSSLQHGVQSWRHLASVAGEYDHLSESSRSYIELEQQHGVNNYHPLPVVLERGYQTRVWDVEGREYLDFVSAYSAVNQGHCHPHIVTALAAQSAKLTLTSRAFHNNLLGDFQHRLCSTLGFDRMLPANSGVEGGEAAIKMARRWGYDVKKIATGKAKVIFAKDNFWGRSIAAVSSSTDPTGRNGFGPFVPGFELIDYDNLQQLEEKVKHSDVCAFMVEPIQGEAGVVVPSEGYLKQAAEICRRHNVLLIADEVQTGLGRTGKMLCCDYDNIKPDMVVLGKALSGGVYPVSAVLGSDEVLGLLKPGEHGSTYGGNPLACAVGMAALDVLENERLCENSEAMGQLLRDSLQHEHNLPKDILSHVRGKGLMNAMVIEDVLGRGDTAWQVCLEMARNGVLAKPTHGHIIRLAPPLLISKEEIEQACIVIREALRTVLNVARALKK